MLSSPGRRQFLLGMAALPVAGLAPAAALAAEPGGPAARASRRQIRAVLISATTVAGRASLEHAWEELRALYADVSRILLINFASLPEDRDAYAERMQRDFTRIDPRFRVDSLHAVKPRDARKAVEAAEAIFVSGGNTFLLLRELYDRNVVGLLAKRVLAGLPYAGSSAGSNIGGIEIGTTNDFPITDVPTRRSLGLMEAVYNPHHPDRHEEDAFGSRQWKIRQYARYNPEKPVLGINNAGMVSVRGEALTLKGSGALATVQLGGRSAIVEDHETANLSRAINRLRSE